MRIGFISTRLAGVDGVSLETAKMVTVLERLGHQCFYCAGELEAGGPPGKLVPAMHFTYPAAVQAYEEAFRNNQSAPQVYQKVYDEADALMRELLDFVREFDLEALVIQNASTIPMNLQLGVAIRQLIARTRLPTICHHHDFYWERERFINNGIQDILDEAFPPDLGTIQHLVISTVMQRRLRSWRGLESTYLPNVFDFETPPPPPDAFAQGFRKTLGLTSDDIVILQPTRVIRRKGIEKAIELVRKLNDERMVLLITGYEGDEPGNYGHWLREEAERAGIRYAFISDWVSTRRGERDGHPVYSLWDVYHSADFVTYPSTYEGFGNGLLETLYFRKPLIVNTYPAYLADIKSVGVQAVEFYLDIDDHIVEQVRRVLFTPELREAMVENNYNVAREFFSYSVLERTTQRVLSRMEMNRLEPELRAAIRTGEVKRL